MPIICNSPFGTMRTFDELQRGSKFRLAKLRRDSEKIQRNHPPVTWRDVRYSKLNERYPRACMGFNQGPLNTRIPVIAGFEPSFFPVRTMAHADTIEGAHIKHRGWFADPDGYWDRGTVRGIVASLPHGRFIRGYHWSNNNEYVLFIGPVYSDAAQCARDADREAEKYADDLREDDIRFRAMSDAESLVESKESDLCAAWADYRAAWCAYLNDPRHAKTAVKAREWVRELISDLRASRDEYENAREAYER